MRSIERYLLTWTLGVFVFGSIVLAGAVYLVLLDEMNEVFDIDLRDVARAVAVYDHSDRSSQAPVAVPPLRGGPDADPPDSSLIVTQTWSRSGKRVFTSDPTVVLPFSAADGVSRPLIGGEEWIVYTVVDGDGVVQAAQRASARSELARESAIKIVPPLLAVMAVVAVLLVFALRRGLQPLDATARDIGVRTASALKPIPTDDVPKEITPLVAAINGLMVRLADAFSVQRRFLADAAHELRTPVTALRLQLQLLQRSTDAATRDDAVRELALGIERSHHLIEQLLQVARSEPDGEVLRSEPVDLGELTRSVVAALSIKAEHRGIDLGAASAPDAADAGGAWVVGDRQQLTVLLNNLVENAVRYTQAGGVVDVLAGRHAGRPMLAVVDNGPGIDAAERDRVFDRFHRGEGARASDRESVGSGLGLSIVRAIADRHGAVVSLHLPVTGRGLEVRVVFETADSLLVQRNRRIGAPHAS